ncbi:malonate decarboxylase holo-ACP synthase [Bordetella sp. FB-8]|uniref:malonate decarboxylase holo-ACP synthase n=1 Tax=Bordetella sp. FB-8 TaxID=1159870 RepID=UPI00037A080D|nr:malonate decarboxylase holo-ACP synthase [Bordetella sp. FB-8]
MTHGLLRAHDLLYAAGMPRTLNDAPLPDWALQACHKEAPMVVRRAPRGADGAIAVGLRGQVRHERLAAFLARNAITRVATPEMLAARASALPHDAPFAALRTLRALAPGLDALGWAWGPTGGVGFLLASGLPVLCTDSDLDLVVRMAHAPCAAQREQLVRMLEQTECRIDLQIDTGRGGFALRDWLAWPHRTLLKTDSGPRLVADPWNDQA